MKLPPFDPLLPLLVMCEALILALGVLAASVHPEVFWLVNVGNISILGYIGFHFQKRQ